MGILKRLRAVFHVPARTMFTEAELFYLDTLFEPDPDRPGQHTRESIITVIRTQLEWGFDVKPGIIGGDGFSAEIDEGIIEEAKRLLNPEKA